MRGMKNEKTSKNAKRPLKAPIQENSRNAQAEYSDYPHAGRLSTLRVEIKETRDKLYYLQTEYNLLLDKAIARSE